MTFPVPILIANYRGGEALQLCIESIRAYTPAGAYRIIVGNDYDPTGTDTAYLAECERKGWAEIVHAKARLHHGGILNLLWNETAGKAEVAVNLDNDTQILGAGWLDDALAQIGPDVLGVCDARPFNCVTTQGYVPPFYRFWFAALHVGRYRDLGPLDWRFAYADRREWPYSEMFRAEARMDMLQKRSPEFDDNRVCIDPGSALWVRVHWQNPKGYRIVPCSPTLRAKWRHIGHVSHMTELPDDFDAYTREHKKRNGDYIKGELMRLRCRA